MRGGVCRLRLRGFKRGANVPGGYVARRGIRLCQYSSIRCFVSGSASSKRARSRRASRCAFSIVLSGSLGRWRLEYSAGELEVRLEAFCVVRIRL